MTFSNLLFRLNSAAARGLLPVALAGALAALAGCERQQVQASRPSAVPVTVADVVQKTVPVQIRAIGNVEAYSTVGVKPQISGEIVGVHFTEGQDVNKGQLLFTLDPNSLEADLKKAEANLIQDEAKLKNAQVQAVRYNKLVAEGVVAKEQADQIQTNYDALLAAVNADRAQVQYDKVQLGYTRIVSPIDGRTGSLMLHRGNVVKANPDNPMVTINQVTPIYVDFSVPQQFLPQIKQFTTRGKLKVEALLQGQEDRPVSGTLSFIDNTVDLPTGTIKLKGTFTNRERRLWPGQFVNVVVTLTEQPNAIVVPTQAVQTGQQGSYVFVVKKADNSAELRPVVVGRNLDGQSVIEKGLQAGELVVTDGQVRLTPGTKVEIKGGSVQAQETRP
jgi:multidrug efflux system membrane fusion protein